jgi:hypothetical protein
VAELDFYQAQRGGAERSIESVRQRFASEIQLGKSLG